MRTATGLQVATVGVCVALSAATLALAADPVYDAWAWLVWGRELTGPGLDLSSGPSWKPLPVGVTALLSLAGDVAPALWLVLVRAAWLLALVLAARLAYALTNGHDRRDRILAAAFAALCLLLALDPVTSWLRQGAEGMSEPLLVALVLLAVLAGIDGRRRTALLLGALAALLRPEVWPLLAAYGLWCWRRERAQRPLMIALAIAVPAAWLAPELMTAGDVLGGAQRAQRDEGALQAIGEVAQWAVALPLLAAWPLAFLAAASQRRARTLLAGALALIAVVALMAAAGGFAGLPRFMAPAAAVVGVLGGVGLARLLAIVTPVWTSRARGPGSVLAAIALAALLVTLAIGVPRRAQGLRQAFQTTGRIGDSRERLRTLVRSVGHEALMRCGDLATSDVLVRTALAWELDVPLSDVVSFGRIPHQSGAFVVGPQAPWAVKLGLPRRAVLLARRGEWSVYSLDCPATAGRRSSSPVSRRSAGVSGARR